MNFSFWNARTFRFADYSKLERSGDHITNIAEEIVFFIDAKVLKHRGKTDENYPEK